MVHAHMCTEVLYIAPFILDYHGSSQPLTHAHIAHTLPRRLSCKFVAELLVNHRKSLEVRSLLPPLYV